MEKKSCKLYESSGRFEEMSKVGGGEKVVNDMKAINIISLHLQWLILENLGMFGGDFCKHMSVSLQWLISENMQTWGGTCAEHIVTKTLFMIQGTNY